MILMNLFGEKEWRHRCALFIFKVTKLQEKYEKEKVSAHKPPILTL